MPTAMQQINQLQLVQSQAQNAHLLSAANVNPLSNMMPGDIEQRMLEYLKLIKENTRKWNIRFLRNLLAIRRQTRLNCDF